MKNHLLLSIICILLSWSVKAQGPAWPTLVNIPASGYNQFITQHQMDAAGNHYLVGSVEGGAITFGSVTFPANPTPVGFNAYLAKFNSAWVLEWILPLESPAEEFIFGLALDPSGNAFICGTFNGQLTLGNTLLSSQGAFGEGYIAKVNPQGIPQWAVQLGNTDDAYLWSMDTDNSGNVYVTGGFLGSATFGGIALGIPNGLNDFDGLLAKLDAGGTVQWVKTTTGPGNDAWRGVEVAATGEIYTTGIYGREVTIGGTVLTDTDSTNFNLIIGRYDAAGNLIWLKQAHGQISVFSYFTEFPVRTDASGNLYIAGLYRNKSMDFGTVVLPGVTITESTFLAKLDATGTVQWARHALNNRYTTVSGFGLDLDQAGNAYLAGRYDSTATIGGFTLQTSNSSETYIAKYDPAGTVLWAQSASGTGGSGAQQLSVDAAGELHIFGIYTGQMSLPGSATIVNSSLDPYLYYASTGVLLSTPSLVAVNQELLLYPNPATDKVVLQLPERAGSNSQIRLFSLAGQEVFGQSSTSVSESGELTFPQLPAGVYLVEVQCGAEVLRQRLVIN